MTAGLVALFLGYLLVWAGVKNVHPWAPLVEAFGGTPPPPPGTASTLAAATGAAAGTAAGTATGTVGGLTPRAAAFKAAVQAQYPAAVYEGGPVCRHVIPHGGGTSTAWSEHSWGNAVDFTGSADLMRRIVAFATVNRLRFGIANIIPPGSAVNAVHVDFLPSHTGQVPPCAKGK